MLKKLKIMQIINARLYIAHRPHAIGNLWEVGGKQSTFGPWKNLFEFFMAENADVLKFGTRDFGQVSRKKTLKRFFSRKNADIKFGKPNCCSKRVSFCVSHLRWPVSFFCDPPLMFCATGCLNLFPAELLDVIIILLVLKIMRDARYRSAAFLEAEA